MLRRMELRRSTSLRGMGEFLLRRPDLFWISTAYRYDDGTALMSIVADEEQLPLPIVATHQEELSLPVVVTCKDQIPVLVTVPPVGQRKNGLHILVTPDQYTPSLPGDIGLLQDHLWGHERSHMSVVLFADRDKFPSPIADWNQSLTGASNQSPLSILTRPEICLSTALTRIHYRCLFMHGINLPYLMSRTAHHLTGILTPHVA